MVKNNYKNTRLVAVAAEEGNTVIETGILYPDGTIRWGRYGQDLNSATGRKKLQEEYDERNAHANSNTREVLQFVTREVSTIYSTPRLMPIKNR